MADNDEDDEIFFQKETMDLSDALVAVLKEIFVRFDVDGDKLLSTDELKAFSVACNERVFETRLIGAFFSTCSTRLLCLLAVNWRKLFCIFKPRMANSPKMVSSTCIRYK